LFAHDLVRKPLHTFWDHALEPVAIKADCIRNDGRSWRILQG